MKSQIKIAGVDITSKVLKWEMERPYGDAMSSLTIEVVKTVEGLVTLTNGQTVEVWRTFGTSISDPADKLFMGSLEKYDVQGGKISISCKDQLILAQNAEVTKVYLDTDAQAGVISDIFLDLISSYTDLNADSSSVQDSGTTYILMKFVCNHNNVFDRLQQLADVIGWQFYYRADTDKVYFEPEGYTANANTLVVGDEIVKVPKWENDSTGMTNSITVIGAKQLTETTEFFSGDGATSVFILANTPESIKVWVGSGGFSLSGNDFPHQDNANMLAGGVEATSTNPGYTVDKLNKKVTFSSIPSNNSNNIEIAYTYNVPIPLKLTDPASIGTYGERESTATIMDVRDLDDAYLRGSTRLANGIEPKTYTELRIRKHDSLGLQVGQLVPITDSVNSVNDTFLINRYVFRYPLDYDVLYVGPKEWRLIDQQTDILNRIKKLEEEQYRDQDAVINLIQISSDVEVAPYSISATMTDICDSPIVDHPDDNGKVGMGITLDSFESGVASWSGSSCSLASETTEVLSAGLKSMEITPSANSFSVSTIQSFGNLSTYTGASTGTPAKGTIGLWVHNNTSTMTSVKLKIGSDSSNYAYYTGAVHMASAYGFTWQDDWTYVIFDLNVPDSVVGTPDWTAVAYAVVEFVRSAGSGVIYADYMTISKSNTIGNNGVGYRTMTHVAFTTTY